MPRCSGFGTGARYAPVEPHFGVTGVGRRYRSARLAQFRLQQTVEAMHLLVSQDAAGLRLRADQRTMARAPVPLRIFFAQFRTTPQREIQFDDAAALAR